MKICVLQPDYSTTGVDYKNYDPPRDLGPLLPGDQVDHVFLNKLTTYKQLKALSKKGYDIFVNLCEGYLEWEIPSIDVIHSLDLLNLPYTGPSARLYDPTKELMKYVAYCEGVATPQFICIDEGKEASALGNKLNYPLFVKPVKAGDSLGIDEHSLVNNPVELEKKVNACIDEFGPLLVEEYVDGREFTVLVAANGDITGNCTAFKPVEYVFPEGKSFKTYALKTSELHPDCNRPCEEAALDKALRDAARRIFTGFGGVGYARLDFRVDAAGKIYFLEINFTCSVFYQDGYEGSADYVLKFDGIGKAGFLRHIIQEGIRRHHKKQKPFDIKGTAISGYGIYASQDITKDSIVFCGEEQSQRLVTRRFVEANWNESQKEIFRRYAYPVSNEVFLLWDDNPSGWAPQNHSCSPNTVCDGLNVVALRNITKGEELTLDYGVFLDEHTESFVCRCGSPQCRGLITGTKFNSVTEREKRFRESDQ